LDVAAGGPPAQVWHCLARGEAGVGYSLLTLTEFEEDEVARLVNSPRDGESGEGGKVGSREGIDLTTSLTSFGWFS